MRWLVVGVVVCALSSFACGGRSDAPDEGSPEDTQSPDEKACRDWQKLDVVSACRELWPGCPSTLEAFLTAPENVPSDPLSKTHVNYAWHGCGVTEIRSARNVVSDLRLTFSSNGTLVGFRIAKDQPSGPCSRASHERGEEAGECAQHARSCWLASDALETGELCACPCPELTNSGAAYGSPECVFAPPDARPCLETAELMASSLDRAIVRAGCGVTVIEYQAGPDTAECWYDNGRAIGGARHLSVPECDGVRTWSTGGPYLSCDQEQRCFVGAGEPPPGTPRCP